MAQRSVLKVIISILLLFALSTFGCRKAGSWLVKNDLPQHADAIALLMGSFTERVLEAADLYSEGKAGRIIIVEEYMGPFKILEERGATIVSNSRQAFNSLVTLGVPADSIIILPGGARSTLDEAGIISEYLSSCHCADTLLIVTSAAHSRRASMIFRTAFRINDLQVYTGCSPSSYSSFDPDRWWSRKEDIQTVLSEVVKTGSFLLVERRQFKRDQLKIKTSKRK